MVQCLREQGKEIVGIQYKIKNTNKKAILTLAPIVNFRDFHSMSTNHVFDVKQQINGTKVKLVIDGNSKTPVYMNLSEGKYIEHKNDIFKDMFYIEEQKRGFYPKENHSVTGVYEIELQPNEEKEISFVCGLEENIEEINLNELIKKENERIDKIIENSKLLEHTQIKNYETKESQKENPIEKSQKELTKELIKADNAQREKIKEQAKPTLKEGAEAAAIAAAFDGVISFATSLIGALKTGKKLNELNSDDWKKILESTGIGVVRGGVTGGGIYALTNIAGMSAPLASSIVTATIGIVSQPVKLVKGEVSYDDFMYNILGNTFEAAASGAGAAIGQVLIPVPVVGAIIGSIVSTTVLRIIKEKLLGGGYYKLVNDAKYEADFAGYYRPLVSAFYCCANEYDLCSRYCDYYRQEIGNTHNETSNTLDNAESRINNLKNNI